MKIIKTAAMVDAMPPMAGGHAPTGINPITPSHAPSPQQMTAGDFEVSNESDFDYIENAVGEMVQDNAHVVSEGHDYDGMGGGYNDMGHNYEINPFSFTVQVHPPMTIDDLPPTLSGRTSAQSDDGRGHVQIEWQAHLDPAPQGHLAKYTVS